MPCSFIESVLEADGVVGLDSFIEEGDCGVAVGVKLLFVKGGEVSVLYFFIESGFNYLFYTASVLIEEIVQGLIVSS